MALKKAYIFYFAWINTSGNHTGMAYWVHSLRKKFRDQVQLIKPPSAISAFGWRGARLWRKYICHWLERKIQPEDAIFFMEYFGDKRTGDQRTIALGLRARGVKNRMAGLVHLPGQFLLNLYGQEYIQEGLMPLDDIIVFGSSLANFFTEFSYGEKVCRTFHYVDTEYYIPKSHKQANKDFTILHMGSLMRNPQQLREIAARCPEMRFEICMGTSSLESVFTGLSNVTLYPYLPEQELLSRMQQADVSLSVFDDTIGSNVIVTSLACGLPQVVSDVGSIHDYCSEENTIFCKSADDFVAGLKKLHQDSGLRQHMAQCARQRAEDLSLAKSFDWFQKFFLGAR